MKVEVIGNIKKEGSTVLEQEFLKIGSIVDIPKKDVDSLIECGVAKKPEKAKGKADDEKE